MSVEQFEEDDGTVVLELSSPRTTTARSSAAADAPPTRCAPSSRPPRCGRTAACSSTSSTDGRVELAARRPGRPPARPRRLLPRHRAARRAAAARAPSVWVGERATEIVRRAGTDDAPDPAPRPASTTARASRRCAARSCSSPRAAAPPLGRGRVLGRGPRRAARVVDGDARARPRRRGCSRMPSCEAARGRARRRRPARAARARRRRARSTSQARRDRRRRARSSGLEADVSAARRRHALPRVVRLVPRAAPRRATRSSSGHELRTLNPRDHTPLSGGQVDDTPFGGGAGMVLRVDVMDAALRGFYGVDPVELRTRAPRHRAHARAAGCSTTASSTSSPPSRRSRCCAAATRASTSASSSTSLRRAVDRPLRALRRRARGDGRRGRRAAQAARARSATPIGRGGVVLRRARRRPGVPALHAPGRVPRLDGPRGAALGPPRGDPQLAPRALASAAPPTRARRPRAIRYHGRPPSGASLAMLARPARSPVRRARPAPRL